MSDEQKNNNFVVGLVIGSSISTIATLVFHPRSGEQTRKILTKTAQALPSMAEDISSSLNTHTNKLSFLSGQKWQRTLHRFQVAVEAGKQATQAKSKRS